MEYTILAGHYCDYLVHNSCHRFDRNVLFATFIIVFYSAHSQAKTKKTHRQKVLVHEIADNLIFFTAANLLLT